MEPLSLAKESSWGECEFCQVEWLMIWGVRTQSWTRGRELCQFRQAPEIPVSPGCLVLVPREIANSQNLGLGQHTDCKHQCCTLQLNYMHSYYSGGIFTFKDLPFM